MSSFGPHGMHHGPSLDLDLLSGSPSLMPNFAFPQMSISDMDKSVMAEIADNAMDEMLKLLQTDEPMWIKSTNDGREILNLESYDMVFPRCGGQLKNPNARVEASRDSGVVIMNSLSLVDMFMDAVSCAILLMFLEYINCVTRTCFDTLEHTDVIKCFNVILHHASYVARCYDFNATQYSTLGHYISQFL